MEFAVHQFVVGLREAVTIWLVLLGLAVLALGCLYLPDRRRRLRVAVADAGARAEATVVGTQQGGTGARRVPLRRNVFVAQAEDLDRYAGEVAVAATRAAVTAQRRWEEWTAAHGARDAAWRAYEAADAAARRVIRAAAFPAPATPNTPAEHADRERYLHRAATRAYWSGELSAQQLTDALSHRDGWDPTLHPFDVDVRVRRAVRDRLLAAYHVSSTLEDEAWRTAETASAAKRCLDDEAYAAAVRARRAHARPVTEGRPSRWLAVDLGPAYPS